MHVSNWDWGSALFQINFMLILWTEKKNKVEFHFICSNSQINTWSPNMSLNPMYIWTKSIHLFLIIIFLLLTNNEHCANNWKKHKRKLNIYILIWDLGSYYSLFVIRVLCVVHICRVECNYEIIMLLVKFCSFVFSLLCFKFFFLFFYRQFFLQHFLTYLTNCLKTYTQFVNIY